MASRCCRNERAAFPKLLILAARAMILLIMNSNALAGEAVRAESQRTPPSIVVVEAVKRTVFDRVLATGSIEPIEEVAVSPLVDGLSIRALNAEAGDWVEDGATLAVLDDEALLLEKSQIEAKLAKAEAMFAQGRAQLAEAKANADEAVRVAERATRLLATKAVSTAETDRLDTLAAAANARLRSAEQSLAIAAADIRLTLAQRDDVGLRLGRTVVKAPAAGVVSVRNAKVGAITSGSAAPLYTIIRDGALEMKANVAETDLVKLGIGQVAMVTPIDGAGVTGAIRLIEPTVDRQTRLGVVRVALPNAARTKVGAYASATIVAARKMAVVLPRASITVRRDQSIVREVKNGVVREALVATGVQDGDLVEIRSGLGAGDRVVAKAGAFVRDGDRITPTTLATPTGIGEDGAP